MAILEQDKLQGCTKNISLTTALVQTLFPKNTIIITSGFRSPEKNSSLPNSSKTSAHLKGMAVDLIVQGVHPIRVVGRILDNIGKFPFIKAIFFDVFKEYIHIDEKDRGVPDLIILPYGRNGELI